MTQDWRRSGWVAYQGGSLPCSAGSLIGETVWLGCWSRGAGPGFPIIMPMGSSFSPSSSEPFIGCPLGADIRGAFREHSSSWEDRIRSTKEGKAVGERIICGPALTRRDAELGHVHT